MQGKGYKTVKFNFVKTKCVLTFFHDYLWMVGFRVTFYFVLHTFLYIPLSIWTYPGRRMWMGVLSNNKLKLPHLEYIRKEK